jgi:hypothetical protein
MTRLKELLFDLMRLEELLFYGESCKDNLQRDSQEIYEQQFTGCNNEH